MKFGFTSIDHALASVAHDTVVGARAAAAATAAIQNAVPAVEGITGAIDPSATKIEQAAFAALGSITKAANDTAGAAGANGVNVPLDAQTIADYKQIYQTLAAQLKAQGQTVPSSPASPTSTTGTQA